MVLYVRFDCINKQQLTSFAEYVQNNVVARRMKIEPGTPSHIVLNDQENEYKFTHDNITVPVHLTDLEKHFPVRDFTIPFYMHVLPKTNQIVLVFNHIIADAIYIFNLITSFVEKQPLRQELFDSPCILLKPQIDKHTPDKKYVQPNAFKIPELPNKMNCQTCRFTCQIDEVPFMKQSHTQRMSIISVLLKLRLLQKEDLISYDEIMGWISSDGINSFIKMVMDVRPFVKRLQAHCGNFISFYYNTWKILKNQTVGELIKKLRQELDEVKEQQQYLEGLKDVDQFTDSGMLKGIVLSSCGTIKTPFKKVNIKQHSYDDQNPGFLFLYTYTIDNYLTAIFQYNDQQAAYANEIRSWIINLIQNCKDEITIEQLYKLTQ